MVASQDRQGYCRVVWAKCGSWCGACECHVFYYAIQPIRIPFFFVVSFKVSFVPSHGSRMSGSTLHSRSNPPIFVPKVLSFIGRSPRIPIEAIASVTESELYYNPHHRGL